MILEWQQRAAPPYDKYQPGAFDAMIGREVPLNIGDQVLGTTRILSAVVADDGLSVSFKGDVSLKTEDRPSFRDRDIVMDCRGKRWMYSKPADVWRLFTQDVFGGSINTASARSWDALQMQFGPVNQIKEEEGNHD